MNVGKLNNLTMMNTSVGTGAMLKKGRYWLMAVHVVGDDRSG
jgi:hypothetical protein